MCVCECVREREREGEGGREREVTAHRCVCVCVCVCVCAHVCKYSFSSLQTVREEDTVTQPRVVCKHIRASSLCLSCDCSPLGLELMVKLRTFINCLYIYFES